MENAYRDTDVINSGTVVTYTCDDEFVYINGDTSREAYCDYETLQWTNIPNPCVGEYWELETQAVLTKSDSSNTNQEMSVKRFSILIAVM